MLSYRKTRDGEWAAFGPRAEVREGPVLVQKKDGSLKQEVVKHVSRPFMVDGVPHCYGFLAPVAPRATGGRGRRGGGDVCAECGRPGSLVSDLEDGLLKHYNCCDIPP